MYNWRVTPDNLVAYVESGAPDLKFPPTSAGVIYERDMDVKANRFADLAREAAQEQMPGAPQIAEEYRTQYEKIGMIRMRDSGFFNNRKLSITGQLLSVMLQPADGFKDLRELALVKHLRDAAAKLGSNSGMLDSLSGAPLESMDAPSLYLSPTSYQTHVQMAWEELKNRSIVAARLNVDPKIGQGPFNLWYVLTAEDLRQGISIEHLADLAF